jgi:hypothetical protein
MRWRVGEVVTTSMGDGIVTVVVGGGENAVVGVHFAKPAPGAYMYPYSLPAPGGVAGGASGTGTYSVMLPARKVTRKAAATDSR